MNIDKVIEAPCWLPMAFDQTYESLSFFKLERNALRAAPFLDARAVNPNTPQITLPVKEVAQSLGTASATPPMIFHSAFCCSTLMAKALDKPGTCLALKEPDILMALANAKRMMRRDGRADSDFASLFNMVMKLLARPHQDGETVILKATNSANNLLDDTRKTGSKTLLMYAGLEDFLISVLKKGEACKSFIRTQYNIFTLDPGALSQINPREAMTLTDLQVASLVWRHQLEMFERYRNTEGAITLRDSDFLAGKSAGLHRAVSALELSHTALDIQAVIDSPVFMRDVKSEDQQHNQDVRLAAAKNIRDRYAADIDSTLTWAKSLRLDGDVLPDTSL